jgi:hypothetical protein
MLNSDIGHVLSRRVIAFGWVGGSTVKTGQVRAPSLISI